MGQVGVLGRPREADPGPAPGRTRPATRRADRLLTALTAVGVFLGYVVVQRAVLSSYDGKMMASVAYNLVRHGSLRTSGDFFGFNTPYSTYGIGTSLAAAPFALFQDWFDKGAAGILTLVNPALLTATAALLLRTGIALGWRRVVATLTALAFAFLTMALWA